MMLSEERRKEHFLTFIILIETGDAKFKEECTNKRRVLRSQYSRGLTYWEEPLEHKLFKTIRI